MQDVINNLSSIEDSIKALLRKLNEAGTMNEQLRKENKELRLALEEKESSKTLFSAAKEDTTTQQNSNMEIKAEVEQCIEVISQCLEELDTENGQ